MITYERAVPSGAWILTALVKDRNSSGNPWGSPFYESRTFFGYSKREAGEVFRDSLTRDGLDIVKE